MKKSISFLMSLVMLLCAFVIPISAYSPSANGEPIIPVNETTSFDLTLHTQQETTFQLPDGTNGTLGIKYVAPSSHITPFGSYDLVDGTWDIYWNAGAFNVSYNIDIEKSKITNAYDLVYSTFLCQVDTYSLKYTSTKSTGTINYTLLSGIAGSFNGILTATISGKKLITNYKEI